MVILFFLVAFIAVIIARACMFAPKETTVPSAEPVSINKEESIRNLAALIRCKTVSYEDSSLEDDGEFAKLVSLLPELYPDVWNSCSLMQFPGRALLFRWKGKKEGEASVLMAHYDVVPVEEENWHKPPFDAVIEDGVMWGRGTLDTKATFNGILCAADQLIRQGFQPEQDIYLAFSGCEEVNGPGAENIVSWFSEQGITLKMVLDEGGAVVRDVFPGVKEQCALIGIAEKGYLNLEYAVSGSGGHASAPKPPTPVGRLARACTKVEGHPFKMYLTKPVLDMFDTLGRHSGFAYRIIFANLGIFSWVLDLLTRKAGGELNALMRTTVAFTKMRGSKAANVIPPNASMVSNLRLNPAETVDYAIERIRSVINDDSVRLTKLNGWDPSPISRTDCEGWQVVSNACSATWPGCLVSPYLMMQCSDSRHYGPVSDKVYRFSAMDMTAEERSLIHGNNERIRLEVIGRTVEFFVRVIKQL